MSSGPSIEAYEGNTGNPNLENAEDEESSGDKKDQGSEKDSEESADEPTGGSGAEKDSPGSSFQEDSSDKRVTVAPRDYHEVKELSNKLGISMSGVYRLALRHFKNESDLV